MPTIFTESDIQALLNDPKQLTRAQLARLKTPRAAKRRRDLHVAVQLRGKSGRKYILEVRQSIKYPCDFSVILALRTGKEKRVNLIRCNGHHSEHLNKLERTRIPSDTCHVHRITERYQQFGDYPPEGFAEETFAYDNLKSAVEYASVRFGIFVAGDEYRGGLFRNIE